MKNHLALETDGRVDLLTGLDAPEIFYPFLQKAIAMVARGQTQHQTQHQTQEFTSKLAVVRFRLVSLSGESLVLKFFSERETGTILQPSDEDKRLLELNDLAFSVARLGNRLSELVRADENVARLGEVTFLLMARVRTDEELEGLLRRFDVVLSQLDLKWRGHPLTVEIAGFFYQQGESLLDLLERAGV